MLKSSLCGVWHNISVWVAVIGGTECLNALLYSNRIFVGGLGNGDKNSNHELFVGPDS